MKTMASAYHDYVASLLPVHKICFKLIVSAMIDVAFPSNTQRERLAKNWIREKERTKNAVYIAFVEACSELQFDAKFLRKSMPFWSKALREAVRPEEKKSIGKLQNKVGRILYLLTNTRRRCPTQFSLRKLIPNYGKKIVGY